jgi:hypothetical protein
MRAVRTGNMVRAFIGETRNAEKRVRALLEKEGILVRAIETARPRLEDSFIDIIGRESR